MKSLKRLFTTQRNSNSSGIFRVFENQLAQDIITQLSHQLNDIVRRRTGRLIDAELRDGKS